MSNIYERFLICTIDNIPSVYFFSISWQYRFFFVFLQREKCLFDKKGQGRVERGSFTLTLSQNRA